MNGSGWFFVRLHFVQEPNAGTPRKHYQFCPAVACPAQARQQARVGRSTAIHEPDSCICRTRLTWHL